MPPPSNLRVSVQWKQPAIFAGEDVECIITFKNVAHTPEDRPVGPPTRPNGVEIPRYKASRRDRPQSHTRNSSLNSQFSIPVGRGHRPTLSVQTASARAPNGSIAESAETPLSSAATPRPNHGRSLSIISLGSQSNGVNSSGQPVETSRSRKRNHGRSSSAQLVSSHASTGPHAGQRGTPQTSHQGTPPVIREDRDEVSESLASELDAVSGQDWGEPRYNGPPPIHTDFKFPPSTSPIPSIESKALAPAPEIITPEFPLTPHSRPRSPRSSHIPQSSPSVNPIARILSGTSVAETPRSSMDVYSMSNHSSETLISEYAPHPSARLLPRALRLPRIATQPPKASQPEVLMMGYAQVIGSFTVDGAIIDQEPFEEVKRKGVVGGYGGGGVVGIHSSKTDSGIFGGFGWGSIGEGLGSLLRPGEQSSIKDMRGIASSKSVPLLTTPQSILFVDDRLAPGQSRTYSYSFTLPKGLPPSHRGRAIKISYRLVIGTQRPGSTRDQQVRSVEVPFRVLGSVNSRGEVLGHDLMSPYIILRDQARTSPMDPASPSQPLAPRIKKKGQDSTQAEFMEYVGGLLDKPRQNSSIGLLSPTEHGNRRLSRAEEPQNANEAVALAIMRSNATGFGNQSSNRFDISRSGRRVATIVLVRPAFRLGETVSAVVDFSGADIPSYFIEASLETSEAIDHTIALRSPTSIHRVTRKVWSTLAEVALFASRVTFSPTIPRTATPDFVTTGVSLNWILRFEFVTPRLVNEFGEEVRWDKVLEELSDDDRGGILGATDRLHCESFEVTVPIRVYGSVGDAEETTEPESLVV
ncbi:Rgp1-domain-containing protein [Eremomyces bilateralis CBS 781.70]|uniref:Rgp1-domain-containing protein n=1 Tax=Eremomyces bilateralis CBS 781.70 TaxID=1392243 RepID=A0A6G1G3X5_9PEZI|nr:Rgp1-domain-containing protein [Eremomyces bilateralis CBS 781.70]KAF1812718.1 Rgp1-domain-containing protein [Eremomyces bilateralis CBS 781.70]